MCTLIINNALILTAYPVIMLVCTGRVRFISFYIQITYFGWAQVNLNNSDAAFQYFDKIFEERA